MKCSVLAFFVGYFHFEVNIKGTIGSFNLKYVNLWFRRIFTSTGGRSNVEIWGSLGSLATVFSAAGSASSLSNASLYGGGSAPFLNKIRERLLYLPRSYIFVVQKKSIVLEMFWLRDGLNADRVVDGFCVSFLIRELQNTIQDSYVARNLYIVMLTWVVTWGSGWVNLRNFPGTAWSCSLRLLMVSVRNLLSFFGSALFVVPIVSRSLNQSPKYSSPPFNLRFPRDSWPWKLYGPPILGVTFLLQQSADKFYKY